MRILVTIPHFFNPEAQGRHGSLRRDSKPRIVAIAQCIASLHQLFGASQRQLQIRDHQAIAANTDLKATQVDVVVCTTGDRHLLEQLPIPSTLYKHHPTQAEPLLLGFECQAVLRDHLGQYDYYCFLEDDLILHDPWFFTKLRWFTTQVGDRNLLQPNRYEVSNQHPVHRCYVDGEIRPQLTADFQQIQEQPVLKAEILGTTVQFKRALNPHSGCYFLTQKQMGYWSQQPYFLDRDTRFIGPLESAATLGIMKTFRIYKPAPEQASFLEIQHFGTGFLSLIGSKVPLGD
jgi:hypothetical protein